MTGASYYFPGARCVTNRGFVTIRRGLLPHLATMSSNATKLYLWLHLAAFWKGPKRGTVETNYADVGAQLQWTVIRVKRTIAELTPRYVQVAHGNQHIPTIIKICKFDAGSGAAGITGDPSSKHQKAKKKPLLRPVPVSRVIQARARIISDTSSDTSTPQIVNIHAGYSAPKKAEEVIHSHKHRSNADSRFAQITEHYFSKMKAIGINPSFDASDGKQLKLFLEKHPAMTAETILATLDNAFASTDHFPLRPGFRIREFLAHEAKYQLGPLQKTVPRTRPAGDSQQAQNELTRSGSDALARYGVAN